MAEERNLFDRLDSIEASSQSTNKKIDELFEFLKNQQQPQYAQPQPQQHNPTKQELFQQFLKESKKSWRWFGTKSEFNKWKALSVVSLIVLLAVGLVSSIVSTICFQMYSTFTFFENLWLLFGIIYLVYASKAQLTYEVNAFAANSPLKFETDRLGMKYPGKERAVFRVFRWLAIIAVPCNVICIWAGMGKTNQVLATIMEFLFLGAIIFAFFINLNLHAQYSVIWVEGRNLTTKERVVVVLLPGFKQFMLEEEFKKKMPYFYE